MAALSWIFGGKKKDDKPITVEVGSEDDFTLVENTGEKGLYPVVPPYPHPPQFYTPLPYNVLPHHDQQPVAGNARTNVQNQLDGVPFVLTPKLEQGSQQSLDILAGLEDLRRSVFQIAADINDKMFDYDFKLERTVLHEASIYSRNNQ